MKVYRTKHWYDDDFAYYFYYNDGFDFKIGATIDTGDDTFVIEEEI